MFETRRELKKFLAVTKTGQIVAGEQLHMTQPALPHAVMPASMTGSGGGDDDRSPHRDRRQPVDAGRNGVRHHRARRCPVPSVYPPRR